MSENNELNLPSSTSAEVVIPQKINKKEVIRKARKKWAEVSGEQSVNNISSDIQPKNSLGNQPNQLDQAVDGTVMIDPKYLNGPTENTIVVRTPVKQDDVEEQKRMELPPDFHQQLQEAVDEISAGR